MQAASHMRVCNSVAQIQRPHVCNQIPLQHSSHNIDLRMHLVATGVANGPSDSVAFELFPLR